MLTCTRLISRFFSNAHHRGSLPQQLAVVWDQLLKTDPEGPTLISHAAYPHDWSVHDELLSVCACSTLKPKKIGISLITLGLYLAAINQAKADLIYWADQNTGGISRANLDGSQQQTLVTGQSSPTGIALDVGAGQMYWTNQSSNGAILRANLDGTGQQTLVGQVIPLWYCA